MSTPPFVDPYWIGDVIIGPQIKYAACIEASYMMRPLIPTEAQSVFDDVVTEARLRKDSTNYTCYIVVFEDWSVNTIHVSNYDALCELTAAQGGASTGGNAVGADAGSGTGATDGASATGTTDGTPGGNTDGASA
jgi:hypothetical protein